MRNRTRIVACSLALLAVTAGCARAQPGDSIGTGSGPSAGARDAVKRIVIGMHVEPDTRPSGSGPARAVVPLVASGLTVFGAQRTRHPTLAEAVPSLENGLWKLLPDGRMETTWVIHDGARWHDGVPLTAEDLVFSLQVGRDRE